MTLLGATHGGQPSSLWNMVDLRNYVAAGYFLSRHAGAHDCTGLELRRITMAHDHSQRRFFPETWALPWCGETREQRIEEAAVFGIAEEDLDEVMAWADRSFGVVFGAWDVFFMLGDARVAAHTLLPHAIGLELWGVGLHRSLVSAFCEASAPPPQQPGFAPMGASGIHIATCVRPAPLAEAGLVLGHEILVNDVGCSFNSPASLHLDDRRRLREAGVVPNEHGLIDSFDDALACCRVIEPGRGEARSPSTAWLPWLIVRYAL